jgi:ABC-type glycerol-3-phosphate transport system permease component
MGFYMLIFLGGLQDIPREYYEAARIDGAGALQSFFKITLPLLQPTSFFVLLVSTVAAVCGSQTFDLIYIMTKGGPANSTSLAIFYIYQQAFPVQRVRLCGGDGVRPRRRTHGDHGADVHADARRTVHLWLRSLRHRRTRRRIERRWLQPVRNCAGIWSASILAFMAVAPLFWMVSMSSEGDQRSVRRQSDSPSSDAR